ncbi:MAG: hypothetical protein Q6364_06265 [Candidatus Hermodarchaeota archaeon]|nr:hypothetical protein [Candidatus Hermodarchaeota archaeon]
MPNPKRSIIVPLGLLISVVLAVIVYFTQWPVLYSLVYNTYAGFTNPLQLYELAWILATIDYLLNFSILYSLLLWVGITILIALIIRNLNATLTVLTVAMLLLGGTWLLFSIKYAFVAGFSISFLFTFFFWQIVIPLAIILGLATIVSLPFWLLQRQRPAATSAPTTFDFECTHCNTKYRSKPLICVRCGKEGSIEATASNNSE